MIEDVVEEIMFNVGEDDDDSDDEVESDDDDSVICESRDSRNPVEGKKPRHTQACSRLFQLEHPNTTSRGVGRNLDKGGAIN